MPSVDKMTTGVMVIACNWQLLNRMDYSRPGVIKNILFNYDTLMVMARRGDQVSAIVCIDVKRAIHTKGVLTFKQRRYLALWWQGHNTIEIATMYHKDPWTISQVINKGFGRISKFLSGKISKTPSETYMLGEDTFHGIHDTRRR